jgi:hypothetical protein
MKAQYLGKYEAGIVVYPHVEWHLNSNRRLFSLSAPDAPVVNISTLEKIDGALELREITSGRQSYVALTNNSDSYVRFYDGFLPIQISHKQHVETSQYVPSLLWYGDFGLEFNGVIEPRFSVILELADFFRIVKTEALKGAVDYQLSAQATYVILLGNEKYTLLHLYK